MCVHVFVFVGVGEYVCVYAGGWVGVCVHTNVCFCTSTLSVNDSTVALCAYKYTLCE